MINGWRYIKLNELINSLNAGISVNSYDFQCSNNQKGILKTSCIYNGKFNVLQNKAIIEAEYTRAKLNPIKGEIIISRMNTPQLVGETGYVDKNYNNIYLPDRLWQTELKVGVCGKWLSLVLTTDRIKEQIKNIATGTSNSMKNISKPNFLAIVVPVPPLQEQQKIAEILSNWDSLIEKQDQLIENKKEFKKGLMQRLLTGKVRFKTAYGEDFSKWEESQLGKYIIEYTEKTIENNQYPVLTSSRNGIVLQTDYFKNIQVTTKENIGYHVIPYGYVTFRTRSDDENFTFNQNTIIERGIVSYFYPVFTFNSSMDIYYVLTWMNNFLDKQIRKEIVGTSQLVLSLNKLKKFIIKLPSLEEQEKIAGVLMVADNEIELLQKELQALKLQKKGLMQRLLTGEVRVKL